MFKFVAVSEDFMTCLKYADSVYISAAKLLGEVFAKKRFPVFSLRKSSKIEQLRQIEAHLNSTIDLLDRCSDSDLNAYFNSEQGQYFLAIFEKREFSLHEDDKLKSHYEFLRDYLSTDLVVVESLIQLHS